MGEIVLTGGLLFNSIEVECLVVAPGGGGGKFYGAGGGAGGVQYFANYAIPLDTTLKLIIGGAGVSQPTSGRAGSGDPSNFHTIQSNGGGGGGGGDTPDSIANFLGGSGGSGGGGGGPSGSVRTGGVGTPGQGYPGETYTGGAGGGYGGGAGGAGGPSRGLPVYNSITGTSLAYGEGGLGYPNNTTPNSTAPGSGGNDSQAGVSGTIIIAYPSSNALGPTPRIISNPGVTIASTDLSSRPGKIIYKINTAAGNITFGTASTISDMQFRSLLNLEYLIVGGGGAAGANFPQTSSPYTAWGGGGGGGGFINSTVPLDLTNPIQITVGAGGSGYLNLGYSYNHTITSPPPNTYITPGPYNTSQLGNNGGSSSFNGLIALGGGGGGGGYPAIATGTPNTLRTYPNGTNFGHSGNVGGSGGGGGGTQQNSSFVFPASTFPASPGVAGPSGGTPTGEGIRTGGAGTPGQGFAGSAATGVSALTSFPAGETFAATAGHGGGAGGAAPAAFPGGFGGGIGRRSSITGTVLGYAGGGVGYAGYGTNVFWAAAGAAVSSGSSVPAIANRGGGGSASGATQTYASGGSGVVVIAYPINSPIGTNPVIVSSTGSLTYTLSTARSGYNVYIFTDGTGTIIFG